MMPDWLTTRKPSMRRRSLWPSAAHGAVDGAEERHGGEHGHGRVGGFGEGRQREAREHVEARAHRDEQGDREQASALEREGQPRVKWSHAHAHEGGEGQQAEQHGTRRVGDVRCIQVPQALLEGAARLQPVGERRAGAQEREHADAVIERVDAAQRARLRRWPPADRSGRARGQRPAPAPPGLRWRW